MWATATELDPAAHAHRPVPPADTRVSATGELVTALLVALATLGVYLATIYPGVLDIGDATKFAFVGKVLGIPHAPGYPLYVVVSHLSRDLPFGTLAYRMNVMSAVFGSTTVALSYLIARRLDVGRARRDCHGPRARTGTGVLGDGPLRKDWPVHAERDARIARHPDPAALARGTPRSGPVLGRGDLRRASATTSR